MNTLSKRLEPHPALARALPFAVFLALTVGQDTVGGDGRFWLYLAKTLLGGWMLWELRSLIPEMKWAMSLEAVVAGVAIFAAWVGLLTALTRAFP